MNVPLESAATIGAAPPPPARVFFALWPAASLAEQLAAVARDAGGQFGGRPTRRETIHLTLVFLGDVAEARLPELVRAASGLRGEAFALTVDQLAFWSHKHLLWAGCSVVPPALSRLVGDLLAMLAAVGVKHDAGRHGFTPHLSLLRRVPGATAPTLGRPPPTIGGLTWPCRSFVLVRSRLSATGPDYQILAEFPLAP